MYTKELPWHNPTVFARYVHSLNVDFVFLYSSLQSNYSGRFSFLSYEAITHCHSLKKLESLSNKNIIKCFGYFGYELKHEFEILSKTSPSFIDMPKLWMCFFNHNIIYDHFKKKVTLISLNLNYNFSISPAFNSELNIKNQVLVTQLTSNMTKESYCINVERTRQEIKKGNFYQANITRKFYGYLKYDCRSLELFFKLCKISPSPYSSFLKLGSYRILSSTPEMFLRIKNNVIDTIPIKGTSERYSDPLLDELSKTNLINSQKDKAENMMIVDLMRNDLTRQTIPGSVYVHDLFKIYSYSTIHHMCSRICAKKDFNKSSLEIIKTCFPPGSVTGAPKIQAVNWCSHIEKINRGVYCGCIGWLSNQETDLSVAIRTLILHNNKFEFQVGGGITYDSNTENEWKETLIKAQAIAKTLNLTIKDLEF